MNHADLLLSAASLRALLFDTRGDPLLLAFLKSHNLTIVVDTLETNLGMFLLSWLVSWSWEIGQGVKVYSAG